MSEVFNIFDKDKAGLIDFYGDTLRPYHTDWIPDNATLRQNITWLNREEPNANFRFKYIRCLSNENYGLQTECVSMALKLTASEDIRPCFIKFPNRIKFPNTNDFIDTECLLLACASGSHTTPPHIDSFPTGASVSWTNLDTSGTWSHSEYENTYRPDRMLYGVWRDDQRMGDWVNWRVSGDGTGGVLHRNWTTAQKTDIYNKLWSICNETTYGVANTLTLTDDFPYWETQYSTRFNSFGMLRYETDLLMTYDELPFPLFDYTQVDDIVHYINTGDPSGALDVFDKNNPKKELIDDFKTNYRIFVSPWEGDKRKTKFTAIAYNTQLIENFDDLSKDYAMSVYEADGHGNFPLLQQTPMEKYPTVGWYVKIIDEYTNSFVFGEKGDYGEVEHDIPIYVYWAYKEDSAVNCRVTDVMRGLEHFSKSNILDGYRYTGSNGQYVEILFRTPTMDDLSGGYSPKEDHEDNKSGTDSDFSGASGLRTFSINNTDFETINKKLWSTDWTSVFKSSSIDPVKCVISCKGIPFTADSVSSAEVVIANMDTGLSKNYVKSVKSFNVGSVLMPHYNDDFTDITLTHIRCYLPYIGWVELPASECISRVAYSKVGIEARPKRLKFKYLVDFVDGSVRCVVSVNDTERWFFDGNCSVDIPVTSDNHTQAVSNALRSGLQTGLSIATAVAGAYTSNAGAVAGGVIGAMQNAPNIFPTYSYTATANGSGYINASMNTHIMIVIERPNTIKSTDYAKRVGVPCGLSLNLGSLHGFTVCKEVDVTGIDATPDELTMIKSLLESGVYL